MRSGKKLKQLKNKTKKDLADKIDKGMLEKASLSLIGNDFRERNNKKKGLINKI